MKMTHNVKPGTLLVAMGDTGFWDYMETEFALETGDGSYFDVKEGSLFVVVMCSTRSTKRGWPVYNLLACETGKLVKVVLSPSVASVVEIVK